MARSRRSDRLATELIRTSVDFLKRRPWGKLSGEEVFLIQVPTELHPLAALVTGGDDADYGLMLSRGPEALTNTLRAAFSPVHDKQELEPLLEQWDRLGVGFAPMKDLVAEDRELLQRAGLQARRETVVPMLLSVRPGQQAHFQLTRQEMRTLRWSLLGILSAMDAGELRLDNPTRTGRPFVRLDVSGSFTEPQVGVSSVPWDDAVGADISLEQLAGIAEDDFESPYAEAPLVEHPVTLEEWKAAELHFTNFIVSVVTGDPTMITPRTLKRFFGDEDAGKAVLGELFQMSPQASLIEWILADDRKTHRSQTWMEKYVARKDISESHRTLALARLDSELSIYRIDRLHPGVGLDVEDVYTGRQLTVHDKSLSVAPIAGIFLPMRLMHIGQWIFALDLGPPLSGFQIDIAMDHLHDQGLPRVARGLRGQPHLLGRLWRWFHEQRNVIPQMQNTDGDPLLWHTASFSVADAQALIAALEARPDLEGSVEDGEWHWLRHGDGPLEAGGGLGLGRLELLGEELIVETNSARRMASARRWVDRLPGVEFLGQQTKELTPNAAQRPLDDRLPRPPAEPMPPELLAEMTRVLHEKHRAWLDQSIPALGGLTPRAACATQAGRVAVERMIRTMSAAGSPHGPIEPPRNELLAELGLGRVEDDPVPNWSHGGSGGGARAIIHVSGPKGAGKTTLIEVLLRRSRRMIIVARGHRDDALGELHEQRPPDHTELRRYRAAGSTGEALMRFPRFVTEDDEFFLTEFMSGFSNAVLVEGDCPVAYESLRVHVVPPLRPGQDLLQRGLSRADTKEDFDGLESFFSKPGGLEEFFGAAIGKEAMDQLARDPDKMAELRKRVHGKLGELRDRPAPAPLECWQIAPGYEGIEEAQVVVVNLRAGADLDGAERLLAELKRIRRDKDVADDVLGWYGSRVAITALAADLSDSADPGIKKLLARLGRAMRQAERG